MSGNNIDPNGWMVTFGDLIMLLLTFFVLLITMKSMDQKVTEEMFEYFIDSEQVDTGFILKRPEKTDSTLQSGDRRRSFVTSNAMLRKTLKDNYYNFRKYFDVYEDDRGVIVTVDTEHLFNTGRAVIRKDGKAKLDMVGELLQSVLNDVLILGHTDNKPIRSRKFDSNWELSCYRALRVYNYLADEVGLDAATLSPGGYGASRPLVPNVSEEGRAKNRRVEFILRK